VIRACFASAELMVSVVCVTKRRATAGRAQTPPRPNETRRREFRHDVTEGVESQALLARSLRPEATLLAASAGRPSPHVARNCTYDRLMDGAPNLPAEARAGEVESELGRISQVLVGLSGRARRGGGTCDASASPFGGEQRSDSPMPGREGRSPPTHRVKGISLIDSEYAVRATKPVDSRRQSRHLAGPFVFACS
jgi:hypothetical protein